MTRRYTADDFIKKASTKHSNKYSYNDINYINMRTKVIISCPVHGNFLQTPADHLAGCGCKSCKHEKIGNLKRKDISTFISESIATHGSIYDYSLVQYKNSQTKIKILCPSHGQFIVSLEKHIYGKGCPVC